MQVEEEKCPNIEKVTLDKQSDEIIIYDADEAKLAALGKKRNIYVIA